MPAAGYRRARGVRSHRVHVVLLGTGGPAGSPGVFCSCAGCTAARVAGEVRARTSVLLDGDLLLDAGPDTALAAGRLGIALPGPGERISTSDPAGAVGIELALRGHRVRVLPGAVAGCAYDVDRRLLYAPHGVRAEAVRGSAYDLVLLGMGTEFAPELAALRRVGAIRPTTRIVAVGLDHGAPHGAELSRRLALWGAEVVPDGTVLALPRGTPPAAVPAPRRVLVLGGARSGKSAEAERRLAAEPAVTYVATGLVEGDPEWAARVAAHRARRPPGWRTVETTDVAPLLREPPTPLLVDCLTLWLAAHDEPRDADELVSAWRSTPTTVVAVSNEVGSGIVPADAATRRFRDALGRLNARVAAESDEVWLMTAGIPRRLA